jgi:hypothetical protein
LARRNWDPACLSRVSTLRQFWFGSLFNTVIDTTIWRYNAIATREEPVGNHRSGSATILACSHPRVLLDTIAEAVLIDFHHIDVSPRCDRVIGCRLKQALQTQTVQRPGDGAARHSGDELDGPKKIELGKSRKDTDVEKRRAEPSPRERQTQPSLCSHGTPCTSGQTVVVLG